MSFKQKIEEALLPGEENEFELFFRNLIEKCIEDCPDLSIGRVWWDWAKTSGTSEINALIHSDAPLSINVFLDENDTILYFFDRTSRKDETVDLSDPNAIEDAKEIIKRLRDDCIELE